MNEEKRHHIDLVEAQILRMSENSKQMKTWCFALVTGIIGIYVQTSNTYFLCIGFVTIALFAWLDAYYLLLERKFRCVYNDIVGLTNRGEKKLDVSLYGMPIHEYKKGFLNHIAPITSISILPFYSIAIIILGILLILDPTISRNQNDVQKIQLVDSTVSIDIPTPVTTRGKDSVWMQLDNTINANIKFDDTISVKTLSNTPKSSRPKFE